MGDYLSILTLRKAKRTNEISFNCVESITTFLVLWGILTLFFIYEKYLNYRKGLVITDAFDHLSLICTFLGMFSAIKR